MELSKKMFAAAVAGSMAMGSAGGAMTHKLTAQPKVVTVEVAPMPKSKPKVVETKKDKKPVKKEVKKQVAKNNSAFSNGV